MTYKIVQVVIKRRPIVVHIISKELFLSAFSLTMCPFSNLIGYWHCCCQYCSNWQQVSGGFHAAEAGVGKARVG